MDTSNEGVKPPAAARSAGRSIAAVALATAGEAAYGILDELVGHSISAAIRTTVATLVRIIKSGDTKARADINQEETIDV
jgi:hypothetical protein